jgi:hypothetical protein
MNNNSKDIAFARRAISSLAQMKYRRRYPTALRARLVALVRAHPERSVSSLARALDMAPQTLERIVGGAPSSFVPVRVPGMVAQASSRGLVVHGPRGITIEGFDVADVAELIRTLT